MKNCKMALIALTVIVAVVFVFPVMSFAETESTYKKVDMNIDVNKEDRDVGLKRMEIIDKALSRDLIERKRALVKRVEADYNEKVLGLLNSIIPPMFDNKVLSHVDINFFAPDFESQVKAAQKVGVSIILKRDGFDIWAKQNPSEEAAKRTIKQLIGSTLRIPEQNISLLVVN